jgi:hypothetical protein
LGLIRFKGGFIYPPNIYAGGLFMKLKDALIQLQSEGYSMVMDIVDTGIESYIEDFIIRESISILAKKEDAVIVKNNNFFAQVFLMGINSKYCVFTPEQYAVYKKEVMGEII